MTLVLYLTLVQTALGMALINCFIPRRALGPGFGKTISTTIFFCLIGPVAFARTLVPWGEPAEYRAIQVAGAAALALWFAYFVALNYPGERRVAALSVLGTLAQAAMLGATVALLARYFSSPEQQTMPGPSRAGLALSLGSGAATSSLVLGSVSMAMLVGHWYLVIPGLAIKWLKGACAVFAASLALKAGAIVLSFAVAAAAHPYGARDYFEEFMDASGLIAGLRVFVGIVIPAGLCFMAYRAAAIRSTQSSTGILFPAMIIVFLGEMLAPFLIIGLGGLYF